MRREASTRASCLYTGTMVHRRLRPVRHEFRYRLAMLCIDLDEAETFAHLWPLFGYERRAPVSLRRADHLGDGSVALDVAVRDLAERKTGARPRGRIQLVTSPCVLGYSFNPISLFLCHDESDGLECIVAEVTNTPWLERHCYVLPVEAASRRARVHRFVTPKELHVSPFLGMKQDYHWRISIRETKLGITIAAVSGADRLFAAGVSLERRPLTRASLARALCTPPLGPWGASAAIYFEALRLWWKGAPYHDHPGAASPKRQDELAAAHGANDR